MRKLLVVASAIILVLILSVTVVACGKAGEGGTLGVSNVGKTSVSSSTLSFEGGETPADIKYTITFVTNSSQTIPNAEFLTMSASQVPIPNASSKPGFRFEGWYLSSSFAGSKISFPYTFVRDTTIYAKWVANTTIRIGSPEELIAVKNDLAGSYALSRNIDLAEYGIWEPLGNREEPFAGVFDGNGYVISNMKIEELVEDEEFNELPIGLFGRVTGQVKNVTLVDYKIKLEGEKSRFMIGGIIGQLDGGTFFNSQAKGEILNDKMSYRKKFVDTFWVTAKPSTKVSLGGAVGRVENDATVSGISTEGKITSYSTATEIYSGGAIGSILAGKAISCKSSTVVYGKAAGGLIGYNDGIVERCSAEGFVSGSLSYPSVIGGLSSYNDVKGTIKLSYATGNVKGRTAGGLVGINKFEYETAAGGLINNCYAKGEVFASEFAGGLIGRHTSKIPYFGWNNYNGLIFDPVRDSDKAGISFQAVKNCMAYGNVVANASETTYENNDGEEERIVGVFYPVFAGGIVGQANEILIGNCIAFGNVSGISHRQLEEGGEINAKNPAYVNNFVGHSTNSTSTFINVYCIQGISITRNDVDYVDYSTVPTILYNEVNEGVKLDSMGFEPTIWKLTGINIESGIYPTLLIN